MESSAFAKSRWLTRGWTLQEPIAPSCLTFNSRDWKSVGTKSTTGVDVGILEGQDPQCAGVTGEDVLGV
jgi:hypothetical protein